MIISNEMTVSKNFIELFQNRKYEQFVFSLMQKSKTVFPGIYEIVQEQSHGECDFIEKNTREKYDAKLPFLPEQIKLLTDGKKHNPKIMEWIDDMRKEASAFDIMAIRNNTYNITDTKLYKIMKNAVLKDKPDENVVFFFPFPIVLSIEESIFLQFATGYLKAIYNEMQMEINLYGRNIFVIYPSTERNKFVLRNLSEYHLEYIVYNELEKFFSYQVICYEK